MDTKKIDKAFTRLLAKHDDLVNVGRHRKLTAEEDARLVRIENAIDRLGEMAS